MVKFCWFSQFSEREYGCCVGGRLYSCRKFPRQVPTLGHSPKFIDITDHLECVVGSPETGNRPNPSVDLIKCSSLGGLTIPTHVILQAEQNK